jgi:hypothetical protein
VLRRSCTQKKQVGSMYGISRRPSFASSRGRMSVTARRAPRIGVKGSRSTTMLRGRGGYFGQKLGSKIGRWVGRPYGAESITGPIGGAIGSAAGDIADTALAMSGPYGRIASGLVNVAGGIAKMTGSGAYVDNSLIIGSNPTNSSDKVIPEFHSKSDGTEITITNREYVGDIRGNPTTTKFNNSVFAINPGQKDFQWLHQVAANFEEYKFVSLVYTYRSTISENSTAAGQLGTVVMATHYNVDTPAFSSKLEMMEYDGAMSCKITESMRHGVECDSRRLVGDGSYFVRTSYVNNGDYNRYDLGKFQIAVCGTPEEYADKPIGELWVTYKVVLRKPKLGVALGKMIAQDDFVSATDVTITGDAASKYAPFQIAGSDVPNPLSFNKIYEGRSNDLNCKLTKALDVLGLPWTYLNIPVNTLGYYQITYVASAKAGARFINRLAGMGRELTNLELVKSWLYSYENDANTQSGVAAGWGLNYVYTAIVKVIDPSIAAKFGMQTNWSVEEDDEDLVINNQHLRIQQVDYDKYFAAGFLQFVDPETRSIVPVEDMEI